MMNSSIPISDSILESLSFASLTPSNIALCSILGAALPFLYTYIVSTLNDGKPTKDGEPPVPPYWIPFVGHALKLFLGMDKLHQDFRKSDKCPGKPRTLYVFGQKIYLVSDPGSIQMMWRKSRTVTFDPLISFVLKNLFGSPETAIKMAAVGSAGVDQTGLEGKPEWMKYIHKLYLQELNPGTPSLDNMTRVYIRELNLELEKHVGKEFQDIDLFAWIKKIMFPASGRALYGYKLRIDDELARHFWKFDSGFLQLSQFYPDFMIPEVRPARDKVLDVLIKWRMEVKDLRDKVDDNVLWDENFGARLIRDRLKSMEQILDEDDHRGHASVHLSLFWGLEANAIPAACWVVGHSLLTPGVLERLKAEVKPCLLPPVEGSSLPTFDVEKLSKLEFLNAVWQESLRLGVSSLSPRIVIEDTEIDGYIYKKGGMIQGLSPLVQVEEEYWGKDALEFNPERWLPLPGEDAVSSGKRIRDYQSKVRPFGGGLTICPGRHFAGQEILATAAVLITAFEWDTTGAKIPEVNRAYFGGGGLPAKGDVRLRVRRISKY